MQIPPNIVQVAPRAMRMALDPSRPLMAQVVVTRYCNLSCGYCNEYDKVSRPVPKEELIRRIDHLADLGTMLITLTGGEPLLHPQLDELVAHVVRRGMVCTSISNGYPLTRTWIRRLNEAGLFLLQMSIDNIEPNEVSQKSLTKLERKLDLLQEHASFNVNINAVLGSCSPSDTRRLVDAVESRGFYMTVGLLHDSHGQVDPGLAGDELASLYEEMRNRSRKSIWHFQGEGWEDEMLRTGASPWKCRAGARYLYVDEFGAVAYCSQRRDAPGIPLLSYTRADVLRAFHTPKGCERSCTISCVRRASALDGWRPQVGTRPDAAGQAMSGAAE